MRSKLSIILITAIFSLVFSVPKSFVPPNAFDFTAPSTPEVFAPPQMPPQPLQTAWETIPKPTTNTDRICHATIYNKWNDRIYLVGGTPAGYSGTEMTSCAEYNPVARTWTERATLDSGRTWISGEAVKPSTGYPQGRIYVFGGYAAGYAYATTYEYDPQTNVWTKRAAMPQGNLAYLTCVWRDSLIYVMGGAGPSLSGTNTVYMYNPFTNTWSSATSLPEAADMGSADIIGDTIFIRQAYNRNSGTLWSIYRKGYINPANPTQITWVDGEAVQTVFNGGTASIVPQNKIYYGGGYMTLYVGSETGDFKYYQIGSGIAEFDDLPYTVARCDFVCSRVAPDGTKELYVMAGDSAGNWSAPNQAYRKYTFYPYDISVSDIISPVGIVAKNITVPVQAKFANMGDSAMTFEAKIMIGTQYADSVTITNFPAGRDTTVTFTPWLTVEGYYTVTCSLKTPDNRPGNNVLRKTLMVPAFIKDFEADNGMFVSTPATNAWEWGIPTTGPNQAHSGQNVWATRLSGNYDNSVDWQLSNLSYVWFEVTDASQLIMAFYHWYYIETYWDVGYLEARKGGGPWTYVRPVGDYPYRGTYHGVDGYSGTQLEYKVAFFRLTELNLQNGDTFQIRWRFRSDASVVYPGWYIDDFCGVGFRYRVRDIGVKQIVSPAGDVPKGPITPTMVVANYGSFTALNFQTFFRIYDEYGQMVYNQAKTVAFLQPERETTLTYPTWTPETVGNYRAVGIVYWAQDQNRGNDTLRRDFFVYWKDVGISEIIQPIGGYAPGTRLVPKCKVKNYGTFEEFDIVVKCSIPELNYLQEYTVPYMPPDWEETVTFGESITVTAGSHDIYFMTTTEGDLNPDNDIMHGVYSGGLLDVGVTAILNPPVGGTVTVDTSEKPVSGKVKNFGDYPWTFYTFFRIYKGATLLYVDSVEATVNAGAEVTLNFTPYKWAADTGEFKMIMKTALLGDVNPANDSIVGTFRVITLPPGWHKMTEVSGAAKPVKSGGALCALGDKIYALVGNNTRDLMVYDIGSKTWTKKSEVPLSGLTTKKKNVKKGASICTDGENIYVIKGNNTQEFWRYKPEKDSWKEYQVGFLKGIKGSSMAFDGDSFIYVICGSSNNEWKRFNRYTETFEACNPASLPADKWKTGSWIVYVPGETARIYALRVGGKTNEFYMIPIGGTPATKPEMPLVGSTGKKKKAKEGSAGAYNPADGKIYALKGGNTLEFFSFNTANDSWKILEDVGQPEGTPAKRVKGGGALTYSANAGGLFAFVGSGTNEFWFYVPGGTFLASAKPSGNIGIQAETKNLKNFTLTITPTRDYLKVAYTLPVNIKATLKIYDAIGNLVYTATSDKGYFTVDIKKFSTGIYIMKFAANEYKATRKLIIH
ncbi:MAG: kelch repeat-containing protein [candidate division WOR-3 bacterium]